MLRGHLELLDVDNPEEIAETRDLLLDEIDRMSRLVGDLILLAKSGRPDFLTRAGRPRAAHPHVLAKARGLGDRAWPLDETGEAIVAMDEQRLTQALLQLADNAVKHTDAGDVVALGSSYDGDRVRALGARHRRRRAGRGPRPDLRAVRPQRRCRAEDEGFGLGLSIVRADRATPTAGTVTVEDAEPAGAGS